MLQEIIKKLFSPKRQAKNGKKTKDEMAWSKKQIEGIAKLRGRLILM